MLFRSGIKDQEFVEASRALGAKNSTIIMREILPNCLSPIIVQTSMVMAAAIILAASLSFIGLGVQPPDAEWGAMLSSGRTSVSYTHLTIRTLNSRTSEYIKKRMQEISECTGKAFKAECTVEFLVDMPACFNDQNVSKLINQYAVELGFEYKDQKPQMVSEDFAVIASKAVSYTHLFCRCRQRRIDGLFLLN